jgi:ribonuclease D
LTSLPEHLISTPQELSQCCEQLATAHRFGLDTEFVGEDTYHPKLCLIQIAIQSGLYLIDPQTVGSLDEFWQLVVDPANLVIVHAGREEVRLCQLWSGATPGNLFDLQIAAGLAGLKYPLGHAHLVDQVLGIKLSKGETLTEWRNRPLTPSQIRYAFDDVRYLLPLWERLALRLDKLGRLDWAREEFERMRDHAVPPKHRPSTSAEKWRKLRGLGSLSRHQLAVVRALFHWREGVAAQANRPARTVVRDDLLVEIARRSPHKVRDLQVIRGLPRRWLDEIVGIVGQARGLPLQDCPKQVEIDQDPNQVNWAVHILTAVLGDFCVKHGLSPALVATNSDLKLLARAHYRQEPMPQECLLAQGWRSAHVLHYLDEVLRGQRAVRFGKLRDEAPLIVK